MAEFNSHHYSAGSENPIQNGSQDDKLTFISMRFSPYTHRVALVLLAKKIPFRVINVDHKKKPEWFTKLNPLGKVPTVILPNNKVHFKPATSNIKAAYILCRIYCLKARSFATI